MIILAAVGGALVVLSLVGVFGETESGEKSFKKMVYAYNKTYAFGEKTFSVTEDDLFTLTAALDEQANTLTLTFTYSYDEKLGGIIASVSPYKDARKSYATEVFCGEDKLELKSLTYDENRSTAVYALKGSGDVTIKNPIITQYVKAA